MGKSQENKGEKETYLRFCLLLRGQREHGQFLPAHRVPPGVVRKGPLPISPEGLQAPAQCLTDEFNQARLTRVQFSLHL